MESTKTENTQEQLGVKGEPLKPIRLGIIANQTNREDIVYYKDELIKINKTINGNVKLIIFGWDGDSEQENWLDGVDFEYVKPTSIIHYFKQLKSLELDVLFVPLIKSIYNATSENYNKYLEAGILKIPILTINIYPYNTLIVDKRNGFLFKEKHELIPYLEHLHVQRQLIIMVGNNAYNNVNNNFNFSPENIKTITNLFVYKNQ